MTLSSTLPKMFYPPSYSNIPNHLQTSDLFYDLTFRHHSWPPRKTSFLLRSDHLRKPVAPIHCRSRVAPAGCSYDSSQPIHLLNHGSLSSKPFFSDHLIALTKDGSIRPIAMDNVFRRHVAKVIRRSLASKLGEELSSMQLEVDY